MYPCKTYFLQARHSPAGQAPSVDTSPPCGQSLPVAVLETSVHLSDILTAVPPSIQILAQEMRDMPPMIICLS